MSYHRVLPLATSRLLRGSVHAKIVAQIEDSAKVHIASPNISPLFASPSSVVVVGGVGVVVATVCCPWVVVSDKLVDVAEEPEFDVVDGCDVVEPCSVVDAAVELETKSVFPVPWLPELVDADGGCVVWMSAHWPHAVQLHPH